MKPLKVIGWPAILARTPYGRAGAKGFAVKAIARGYAMVAHPNYDAFWASLNPAAQAERVNAPVLFYGGWYSTRPSHILLPAAAGRTE